MKVLVIFGTRPEAIKCFPVVHELQRNERTDVRVCVTAQHRGILDQVLDLVGLVPDHDLDLMRPSPTLANITNDVLEGVEKVILSERPDRILVQGDTTTTMASALAAFYHKVPVGHIEAGLRSGDNYSPFPEEMNRKIVGSIADLHFAPTPQARNNLLKENVSPDRIHVTGNTAIDALHEIRRRLNGHGSHALEPSVADLLDQIAVSNKRLILVTSHRRENWGAGIDNICRALRILAARGDVHIIFPVHPNPKVHGPVHAALGNNSAITLLPPVDYLPFVELMSRAYLILSDSGGVQEEAPALGKPVLVMRDTTERPEGVEAGVSRLVGVDTQRIVSEAVRLLSDEAAYREMSHGRNPYGDGMASQRIVESILAS